MKNFVFIIAFVFLIKPLWPIIEYVANYDYIATVLCENKDQPELECNGKCYLEKQLAKDAADDKENPLNKSSQTEIPQVIVFEKIRDFNLEFFVEDDQRDPIVAKPDMYHNLFSSEILDPPKVI